MPHPRGFGCDFGVTAVRPVQRVRASVDEFIDQWLPSLTARQEAYLATHGRYWQGLATHTQVPAYELNLDGDAVPDLMESRPHYQAEDWTAMLPEWSPLRLLAVFVVDQYVGPAGPGWTLAVRVLYAGTQYARVINVGPETYRNRPWAVVPPMGG